MSDPLSEIIALLQPRSVSSKRISGAGRWAIRYEAFGQPSFCVVLAGSCRLAVRGHPTLTIQAGDFVLLPATPSFTMSSFETCAPTTLDPRASLASAGEVRHGTRGGKPSVRILGGYFSYDSPDVALLVALLPALVHIRDEPRLAVLVELVGDEALARRSGRALVLTRLVEVLLIEALRAIPGDATTPGLVRGLHDVRVGVSIRAIHADVARGWTVPALARLAGMSRSAFFERFSATVGVPPMAYLLAWRMAVARDLLRRGGLAVADVAERVGYASASTFSTAFRRHVGQAPGRFGRGAPAS